MIGRESDDDGSVAYIFDIINDESYPDTEYNGIEDDVRFQRKVESANRGTSRRYTRPIFKEPKSKLTEDDYQLFGAIPLDWKKAFESLPTIINPLSYQSETDDVFLNDIEGNPFQSSRPEVYRSRLEYIVGNAIERHKFNNDTPVSIQSRLLLRYGKVHSHANQNKESRVAAMNDIDMLETKKLRPHSSASKANGGELNVLRKEINKIINSKFDRRDTEGNRGLPSQYYDFDVEEREGCEGCSSNGCVGVELRDLIQDVIFGKEKWKCVSN